MSTHAHSRQRAACEFNFYLKIYPLRHISVFFIFGSARIACRVQLPLKTPNALYLDKVFSKTLNTSNNTRRSRKHARREQRDDDGTYTYIYMSPLPSATFQMCRSVANRKSQVCNYSNQQSYFLVTFFGGMQLNGALFLYPFLSTFLLGQIGVVISIRFFALFEILTPKPVKGLTWKNCSAVHHQQRSKQPLQEKKT